MRKRLREQEVEFEEKDAQLESLQKEVKIIKSDFGRTRREFSNLQVDTRASKRPPELSMLSASMAGCKMLFLCQQ